MTRIGSQNPWQLTSPFEPQTNDSDASMAVVLKWFDDCLETHKSCPCPGDPILPTRVLDIGTGASNNIKLVETNGMTGQYICLSYCWGTSDFLKTTRETVADHRKGIALNNLPQVFQDAIRISWALKIRYLWIDALCIIQKDEEDWDAESKLMAEVYRGSCLTIAAVSSANPHQTCFSEETQSSPFGPALTLVIRHHFANTAIDDRENVYPMLSRAWTYQERLLAPRVLYMGRQEMLWDCVSCRTCQCGGAEYKRNEVNKGEFYNICLQPAPVQELLGMQRLWYHMVIQYSSLRLTVREDKLPAISGLANVLYPHRAKTPDSYLAGLWRDTLIWDLCWSVRRKGSSSNFSLTAPSWSWASSGEILEYPEEFYSRDLSFKECKEWAPFEGRREWASVSNAFCLPDGPSATGRVKKGAYIDLNCDMIPIDSSLQGYPWGFVFQGNDMFFQADREDTNPAQPAYFIPLTSTQYYGSFKIYGLVVIPKSGPGEVPEYKRIGFAEGGRRGEVRYNSSGAKNKLRLT